MSASTFSPSEARVRRTLLDLWARTRADWGFVTTRISQAFREARDLHSAERRLVAETLYGMVRHARALDWLLREAGVPDDVPGPNGEPTPQRALLELLTFRVVFEDLPIAEAHRERDDVSWARMVALWEGLGERGAAFGLRHGLPDWLAERFEAVFGDEAADVAAALNQRAPLTLRANRLKASREVVRERLRGEGLECEPTRWAQDGLVAERRINVFGLKSFREGLFEVQDEASQLVAELVAPPPRGLVVDACAGAGGKTLALAGLMGGRGRITSLDTAHRKLTELLKRARRAGLSNHRTVTITDDGPLPTEVARLEGRAHRVLVDVPCSGLGALRRNPEARWRLTPDSAAALPEVQLAIARRMLPLVAPGGRLIYATCTILPEENEEVVARLLAEHPELERVSVAEILGKARTEGIRSADGLAMATRPDRHGMDGFYAAVLRRR